MKITISDATLVLDVQVAVSTEETRYYLNGFHVERAPTGIFIVSTDGHRMIVAHDDKGEIEGACGPIKLSKSFLSETRKAIKKAERSYGLVGFVIEGHQTDNLAALTGCDATNAPAEKGVIIDGNFPDWKRVLPKIDPEKTFVPAPFNSKYLGDFDHLCRKGTHSISLYGHDEQSPYLVKILDRHDIFGVLMPTVNRTEGSYPSWLGDETIRTTTPLESDEKAA